MSKSANVRSVQALKDFRIALCNFADDARGALGGVEMELRKFRDWLERDQLGYWQMQVKRRQQMIADARAALHKKKLSAGKSDAVSDSEEKENLRKATQLLRVAEEKVEIVRKLIPQFHQAVASYHSHSQPLGDHMSGGFERSLARLSQMIDSIEAYLALQAPATAEPAGAIFTSSSGGAAAAKSTATTNRGAGSGGDEPPPARTEAQTQIGQAHPPGAAAWRDPGGSDAGMGLNLDAAPIGQAARIDGPVHIKIVSHQAEAVGRLNQNDEPLTVGANEATITQPQEVQP